jgi:hypothetical protein
MLQELPGNGWMRCFNVDFGLLVKNPVEAIRMPFPKTGKRRNKPYVTPQQFDLLLARMPEPYSSMVYVAVYTGLRVSNLLAYGGMTYRSQNESAMAG